MSVEITMDPDATAAPAAVPTTDKPIHVLISPIIPVASGDGSSTTAAAALPQAYTGVLYLHHEWQGHDSNDPKKKRKKWLEEMRGWLMVLAVLAASVTYQAGLNPPGGFWQQDDNQGHVAGTPVLQDKFPKR